MKKYFLSLIILVLLTSDIIAQKGIIVGVKDGDTVVLLDDNKKQHIVRVADIDCPEKNQPYGKKAKWFTSDQIFGKRVHVSPKNPKQPHDKWGRIIGFITYEDKDLSEELLKAGLAWHYKYYSNNKKYASIEANSKKENKGLWKEKNPINPYNWRRGERN